MSQLHGSSDGSIVFCQRPSSQKGHLAPSLFYTVFGIEESEKREIGKREREEK